MLVLGARDKLGAVEGTELSDPLGTMLGKRLGQCLAIELVRYLVKALADVGCCKASGRN